MAECDCEEDIFDSWEDIEESVLEKKLKGMKVSTEVNVTNNTQVRMPIVDDSGRTLYQPHIKILQRIPNSCQSDKVSTTDKSSTTNKRIMTLEQRETAYAEARQRIMGNAYCKSDNAPEENTTLLDIRTPRYILAPNSSLRQPVDAIRQPTGPDGSTGFKKTR